MLAADPEAGKKLNQNVGRPLLQACVDLAVAGTTSPIDAEGIRDSLRQRGIGLATYVRGRRLKRNKLPTSVVVMQGDLKDGVARSDLAELDLSETWWSDLARLGKLALDVDEQRWRPPREGIGKTRYSDAVVSAFIELTGHRWRDDGEGFVAVEQRYAFRLCGPPEERCEELLPPLVWEHLDAVCAAYVRLDLPHLPERARAKAAKIPALVMEYRRGVSLVEYTALCLARLPQVSALADLLREVDATRPFGRDEEAVGLGEQYADGGVTVIAGPSGVGKTYLTGWFQAVLGEHALLPELRTKRVHVVDDEATLSAVISQAFAELPPRGDADRDDALDTRLVALVYHYASNVKDPMLLVLDGIGHIDEQDLAQLAQVPLGPRQQILVVTGTVAELPESEVRVVNLLPWPDDVAADYLQVATGRPDQAAALAATGVVDCLPIWCREIAHRARAEPGARLLDLAESVAAQASGGLRQELDRIDGVVPGFGRAVTPLGRLADVPIPEDLLRAVVRNSAMRDELETRRFLEQSGPHWTQHSLRRRALFDALDPSDRVDSLIRLLVAVDECIGSIKSPPERRRAAAFTPHAHHLITQAMHEELPPDTYIDLLNRIGDVTRKQENYALLLTQRTQLIDAYCHLIDAPALAEPLSCPPSANRFADSYESAVRQLYTAGGARVGPSITAPADFAQAIRLNRQPLEALELQRTVVRLRDELLADSLEDQLQKDKAHAALGLFLIRSFNHDDRHTDLLVEALDSHKATLAGRQRRLDDAVGLEEKQIDQLRSAVWSSEKALARAYQVAAGSGTINGRHERPELLVAAQKHARAAVDMRRLMGTGSAHTDFTLHCIAAELALLTVKRAVDPVERTDAKHNAVREVQMIQDLLPRFVRPGSRLRARRDMVKLAKGVKSAGAGTTAFHPGLTTRQWAQEQITWALTASQVPPDNPDVQHIMNDASRFGSLAKQS